MNQSIKKITRYICLFVGVIFLINTPVVWAKNKSPYYVKPLIWKGIITIKQIGSADYVKKKNFKSNKSVSSVKTSLSDKVEITFCGAAENVFIEEVIRTYIYNCKKTFHKQYLLAHCPLPLEAMKHNILYRTKNYPSSVKKPGNSRKIDESIIKTIYSGKDCASPKEMTSISLICYPDGRYSLVVGSNAYTTTQEFVTDKEKLVCNNSEKVHRVDIRTCGFDEKEETKISKELISSKIHPRLVTLAFMSPKNSYIENNSIKGSMKISETKPKFEGGYKEISTASWDLNAKDPCPIVYRNIMYDIALAEAFADMEIMDLAESMEEYLDLVDQKANEIYRDGTEMNPAGCGGPEGGESPAVRMRTNPTDCVIIGKDEYKNQIAKKCLPYILYKESLAHEKKHVDQCKKYHNEFIRGSKTDPEIRGMMEVGAYLRGIKKLFYWLKENCEEYDLADVKVRIKNIKALPIKLYK
ncbi:MAG: hypothetical protein B6I30_08170 [Desulfobacteraceae bacterium 4572_187]|nr:MAG: hypothetical protein B6I30_08170 [Desulfobacteraceae bacterium 4572_187]